MGSFHFVMALDNGGSLTESRISVSYPVKCSILSAKNKKAVELKPDEKTIYYERCMLI